MFIALGFAAYVGHAVMLANGRRIGRPCTRRSSARQPAYAGVVTGSFVTAQQPGPGRRPEPRRLAQPAVARGDLADDHRRRASLGASLLLRGIVVGRGPWGNMFEFTVAFSFSIVTGYLILARRYAIGSIGFIPTGVALALLLYASSLPTDISQLVPALQNPPLLTIHVGMAVLSYGIFATSFAAGRRLPRPGRATTATPGCPRTRSSTRSPTRRSSSASRSSPR